MAVVAYVAGYLVLCYYLSSFGFNPVSPFRPRVLSTGACCFVCLAAPILIGLAVASIPDRGLSKAVITAIRILCLFPLCTVANMLLFGDLSEISVDNTSLHTHPIKALIVISFILLFWWVVWRIGPWAWKNYHTHPTICTAFLMSIAVYFTAPIFMSTLSIRESRTLIWFLVLSVVTCTIVESLPGFGEMKWRRDLRAKSLKHRKDIEAAILSLERRLPEAVAHNDDDPVQQARDLLIEANELRASILSELAELDSHTSVLRLDRLLSSYLPVIALGTALLAVTAYARWIFPHIPLKMGGGEVVSVTVYEEHSGSEPHTIHAGLLDQSDEGFFVLPKGSAKGLFLPKERVRGVYFFDGPDTSTGFTP